MSARRLLTRALLAVMVLIATVLTATVVYLYNFEESWGPQAARWLAERTEVEITWDTLDLRWPVQAQVRNLRVMTQSVEVEAQRAHAELLPETWGAERPTVVVQGRGVIIAVAPVTSEREAEREAFVLPELPVDLEGDVSGGVRLLLPSALTFTADGAERLEVHLRRGHWTGRGRIVELQMHRGGEAVSPPVGVQAHTLTMTNDEITGELSVHRGASLLQVTGSVPWANVESGATSLEATGALQLDDPALRDLLSVPALDDVHGAAQLEAHWSAPTGMTRAPQRLQVHAKGEDLRWREMRVDQIDADLRGSFESGAGAVQVRADPGQVDLRVEQMSRQGWKARARVDVAPPALTRGLGLQVDAREWLPQRAKGELEGRGTFSRATLALDLSTTPPPALNDAPGLRNDELLAVKGGVELDARSVSLREVQVEAPHTQLAVDGALWPKLALRFDLERTAPVSWESFRVSALYGRGVVRRTGRELQAELALQARDLDHPTWISAPAQVSLEVRTHGDELVLERATVSSPSLDPPLHVSGTFHPQRGDLDLRIDGTPVIARVRADTNTPAGHLSVDHLDLAWLTNELGLAQTEIRGIASGELALREKTLEGELRVKGLAYGAQLTSPADIMARVSPGEGSQHRLEISAGEYLALRGDLDLSTRTLSLTGRLHDLPVGEVAPDLASRDPMRVSTDIELTWAQRTGDLTLRRVRVHLPDRLFSSPEITLRLTPDALTLAPTRIASESLVLSAQGQLWPELTLDLDGVVDMALLPVLAKPVEAAQGQLAVAVAVRGGLDHIEGTVAVQQPVRVALAAYPRPLVLEKAEARFDGRRLNVEAFTVAVADGVVTGSAALTWSLDPLAVDHFRLSARGRDIPYSTEELGLLVGGHLVWKGDLQRSTLGGRVEITRASYQRELDLNPIAMLTTRSVPPPPRALPAWLNTVDLDLAVKSQRPVELRLSAGTLVAEVSADVDVGLQGTAVDLRPSGRVSVADGRMVFPAAELSVTQGEVDLSPQAITVRMLAEGDIRPVRSARQFGQSAEPYWVQVLLEGTLAEGLELRLSSSPPEDELGVLGLLMSGAAPGDQTDNDLLQARTALTFASERVAGYILDPANRELRKLMGESFDLTANITAEGLAVGAQQTFTQRLTLGVGVEQLWASSATLSSAQLQLLLTDRLRIETQVRSLFGQISTTQELLINGTQTRLELKYRVWGP